MNTGFALMAALAFLGMFGVLIDVARSLRRVRQTLELGTLDRPALAVKEPPEVHHSGGRPRSAGAFSIWCYEDGKWARLSCCGRQGCECQPPPLPGNYAGQVVRKECPVE